ncbi:MAG: ribonuclease P protein component [Rikenellaceae bacterium]
MYNSPYSLSHSERLRSLSGIKELFSQGESGFVYPLRYVWRVKSAESETEETNVAVLFTVSKKFHRRANKRNLLRRRVKEAYRLQKEIVVGKVDSTKEIELALIYSTKEAHTYKTIRNAVRKILEHISTSC